MIGEIEIFEDVKILIKFRIKNRLKEYALQQQRKKVFYDTTFFLI